MKILLTGNGDLAKAIFDEIGSEHNILLPTSKELNVTNIDDVKSYLEYHIPDVVVNLAGTLYSSPISSSNPDAWIKDINVNLIGTYLVCRYSLECNKKVRIINISSTAAYNSYHDWTSYCAAKSGVVKLSNGLSIEGFNTICLCPGAIDTKIRNGLSIANNNVMSIGEGIKPIIDAINNRYNSGDIIFYRKNEFKVIREI